MPSVRIPKLRRHKTHRLGVVTLSGRDHYLGPWPDGQRQPPAVVRAEYDRLLNEWLAAGRRQPGARSLSVNELILAYWQHAETYYRHPDGTPTSERDNVRRALRPLRELYGHTEAAVFGPQALEAVRGRLVQAGRCRAQINKDVARLKRAFRWAAAKGLVPAAVWQGLAALEGLRAGRSAARETAPVRPVADELVEATLPHLTPPVRAMVHTKQG